MIPSFLKQLYCTIFRTKKPSAILLGFPEAMETLDLFTEFIHKHYERLHNKQESPPA